MYITLLLATEALPSYKMMASASLFALAGVVSQLFYSCLATPFFTIAAAMALTTLAVKIYSRYAVQSAREFKAEALEFQKRYPRLQVISFLFILALSMLSPLLSLIPALLFGAYAGLLIDADQWRRNHQVEEGEEELPPITLI